jgi:hypothetical protein
MPTAVVARSKARNVFAGKNTRIVGTNPTEGMDVCLRLCCLVQVAALRQADPLSKESFRLSIRLRNLSEKKRFTDALCYRGSKPSNNTFFQIYFNIILPSTPRPPKWCFPFRFRC